MLSGLWLFWFYGIMSLFPGCSISLSGLVPRALPGFLTSWSFIAVWFLAAWLLGYVSFCPGRFVVFWFLRLLELVYLLFRESPIGDPLGQHANLGVNMHSSVSEMQTLWYNL